MPVDEVEAAGARLLEVVPAGFEERETPRGVELAAYVDATDAARVLDAVAGAEELVSVPVPSGWEDRWRAFHRPVRAGGLWIGPPWEDAPPGELCVVVDPGRAFGTGAHPTTRLCIELLAGLERGSLLDAGCGSGVVAVAAARLGFAPLAAVDLDPAAVDVARETVKANGVAVSVTRADVLEDDLPVADVVVANIELHVVERLLERVEARWAVTSGYLAREAPLPAGWQVVGGRELDGWAAHVLVSAGH